MSQTPAQVTLVGFRRANSGELSPCSTMSRPLCPGTALT
jgi:hypothetical protein